MPLDISGRNDLLSKAFRQAGKGRFVRLDAHKESWTQLREGYRLETYQNGALTMATLIANVRQKLLLSVFLTMIDQLGNTVDVIVETSHESRKGKHKDLFRGDIDLSVLKSICLDFEDILIQDGCTGIAVMSQEKPLEIQLREHKFLVVYADRLKAFRKILEADGIRRNDTMQLVTDGPHLRWIPDGAQKRFGELKNRLSAEEWDDTAMDD